MKRYSIILVAYYFLVAACVVWLSYSPPEPRSPYPSMQARLAKPGHELALLCYAGGVRCGELVVYQDSIKCNALGEHEIIPRQDRRRLFFFIKPQGED